MSTFIFGRIHLPKLELDQSKLSSIRRESDTQPFRILLGADYQSCANHSFLDEMLKLDETWLSEEHDHVPFFLVGGTLSDVSDGLLESGSGFSPSEQLRLHLEEFSLTLDKIEVQRFELVTSVSSSIASDFETIVCDFSKLGSAVASEFGADEMIPSLWVFCTKQL